LAQIDEGAIAYDEVGSLFEAQAALAVVLDDL
jgi:hypothetical protein